MKLYNTDAIRNVAIAGHQGIGKTTLVESMLYLTGAIDRLGRVEDGTTVCDFDPDEAARDISINAAVAPVEWNNTKINLIDVPGYADFVGEVKSGLRVADAVLLLVASSAGVEVGTEVAWEIAGDLKLPRVIVVNKIERENAEYERALESIKSILGDACVPFHLPIGEEGDFKGVVDVVSGKAILGKGRDAVEAEIPAELADEAAAARELLIERAAEGDEELMERYFEGEELSTKEIIRGLKVGICSGDVVPILCASGLQGVGVRAVLDAIQGLLPSPAEVGFVDAEGQERAADPDGPVAALVFKTVSDPYVGRLTYYRVYSGTLRTGSEAYNSTQDESERLAQLSVMRGKTAEATTEVPAGDIGGVAKLSTTRTGDTLTSEDQPVKLPGIDFPQPVYARAVVAETKADEDKLGPALGRLVEEDPSFTFHREAVTGETIISGQGETHLNVAVERLKRLGSSVVTHPVKVQYRETIRRVARVQGRHKKQTGGRGQFGDCWVNFEPLPRGSGYEFVNKIVGGSIPRQYIPAVDRGIQENLDRGPLARYPVVDFRATCEDGSYHDVDSSEQAFKMAGGLAFRRAMEKAAPVLLEPIITAEIVVPDEFMGDVIADMNAKRGQILGMEPSNGRQTIKAKVPQAEMMRYAIDLRSIARGRGSFRTEPSHYEEVPAHLAEEIIEQSKREQEDG